MHAKLTVLKYKFTKRNFPVLDQASFWQSSGTLRLLCTVDENITQNIHIFDLLVSSVYY